MGRRNAGSPVKMAEMAVKRKGGARALRRAAEAIERKSIPALKKMLRREQQRHS